VLNFTSRLPRDVTGSMDASHRMPVIPRKSSAAGSLSRNGCVSVPFSPGKDGPYHPIPEELITALTLFAFSVKAFTRRRLPRVLLSTKIFFLFDVQRLSAIPAPARWIMYSGLSRDETSMVWSSMFHFA